jgi:hypothetical protein
MRWLLQCFGAGIVFSIVVTIASIVVIGLTGPVYDRWEWHEVAAALLFLGTLALAGLVEFLRPQNPYKHLNPLYGLQDVPPTGSLDSGGWGWMLNCVPPLALGLLLVMVFQVRW